MSVSVLLWPHGDGNRRWHFDLLLDLTWVSCPCSTGSVPSTKPWASCPTWLPSTIWRDTRWRPRRRATTRSRGPWSRSTWERFCTRSAPWSSRFVSLSCWDQILFLSLSLNQTTGLGGCDVTPCRCSVDMIFLCRSTGSREGWRS